MIAVGSAETKSSTGSFRWVHRHDRHRRAAWRYASWLDRIGSPCSARSLLAGFFAVPSTRSFSIAPGKKTRAASSRRQSALVHRHRALSRVYYVFTSTSFSIHAASFSFPPLSPRRNRLRLMLLPEWFGRLILFFVTGTPSIASKSLAATTFREDGALLVCNHMSFVDVALLIASTDRPIRFLMYRASTTQDHQAIRQNDEGHPHLQRTAPRDMIRSLHTSNRGSAQRRNRLHLR